MAAVDILLASYNGEKYIRTQLDSLLAQTLEDTRILIRDDGSSDQTAAIIREYAAKYPEKVVLIEDEKKCGSPTANFMELMNHADAEYVMFSDQDDFWLPEKAEKTLAAMIEAEHNGKDMKASGINASEIPGDISAENHGTPILVFSDYIVADADLQPMDIREDQLQIAAFHTELNRLLVQNYVTGCTMMLNRTCYENIRTYDPRIQMHDWWAALYCSAFGKVVHIPEKLMYYRQHGGNVVSAMNVKSFSYRWKKLHDTRTKNNWKLGVAQAQLFWDLYQEKFTDDRREILQNFLELDRKNKIGKIHGLIKGNYLKSDLVRVLGQFYFV